MSRTNIDIDDEACVRVMQRFGLHTKKDAVNFALREVAVVLTVEEARSLKGVGWEGDLDVMRGARILSS